MPINPMTGQLYQIAGSAANQIYQNAPIGLQALQQRPDQFKAMDAILGGGPTLAAIKYRSHRSLLLHGEYKSRTMRKLSLTKDFDKSLADSADDPLSWKNMYREFVRDQKTRFNPFDWARAPSMRSMDPETARTEYAATNWILNKTGLINNSLFKKMGAVDEDGKLKHLLDPNFTSRIGAGSTWDRRVRKAGNYELNEADSASIRDYLEHANPDLFSVMKNAGQLDSLTGVDAGAITRMGMNKVLTGRVGGFVQGALHPGSIASDSPLMEMETDIPGVFAKTTAGLGYAHGEAYGQLADVYRKDGMGGVKALAGKSSEDLAAEGLGETAAKKFAEKGAMDLAMRTGLELGGLALAQFIPGVDIAVDAATIAYLAYKGTQIGAKMVNKGIKTAGGAFSSFEGNIRKPQFGMGYHDTLAAATSRARGVAAIQNSQLNARSVLGNEAASIYQHFGS